MQLHNLHLLLVFEWSFIANTIKLSLPSFLYDAGILGGSCHALWCWGWTKVYITNYVTYSRACCSLKLEVGLEFTRQTSFSVDIFTVTKEQEQKWYS